MDGSTPASIRSVEHALANGEVLLNASSILDNERSLLIPLITEFSLSTNFPKMISLKFLALLDSGSTDCFLDSKYVLDNNIPTIPITPINLRLFDGSYSPKPITQKA